MRVLFVCTGNASRSVMGEYLFRRYLAARNVHGISCESAGTEAVDDLPASEDTIAVCNEIGVDLTPHRRRLLTKELAAEADCIVIMEDSHQQVLDGFGVPRKKVHRLSGGIEDPYHKPYAVFLATRDAVLSGLDGLYDFLQTLG